MSKYEKNKHPVVWFHTYIQY